MRLVFAVLVGALLAMSCTREQPQSISLQRTSCYGWCPAYRVVITADGRIEYSGDGYRETISEAGRRLNPEYLTRASSRLSPVVTAAVFAAFDEGWSRWRQNRYSGGSTGCGYDEPTMWLERSYRTRADTMELYYGCDDAPARLAKAADKVDSLVEIDQWLGPSPSERAHAQSLRQHAARLRPDSSREPSAAAARRLRTRQIESAINSHHRARTMRRHFTPLLLSSLVISLTASSAAAQSARDTVNQVQVKIERKTPVFESPSFAANTVIMALPGQFTMRELVVQNGFIRVPLQSIKPSLPAKDGWITGAEVSARVVRVRVDTVTVTHADTVLRTRVDSVPANAHPRDHRE